MKRFKSSENIPASLPPRQHMSCESDVGFRSWTYGGDAVVPSMLDGPGDQKIEFHESNSGDATSSATTKIRALAEA